MSYDYEPWSAKRVLPTTQPYLAGTPQAGDYTSQFDYLQDSNSGGFFDSLSGSDYIDGIGGIGQLGLGYMNFLENKKLRKAQIKGLNQQIAESKYGVQAHKNFVGGTKSAFS